MNHDQHGFNKHVLLPQVTSPMCLWQCSHGLQKHHHYCFYYLVACCGQLDKPMQTCVAPLHVAWQAHKPGKRHLRDRHQIVPALRSEMHVSLVIDQEVPTCTA